MATITQIAAAFEDALDSIGTLRTFNEQPDSVQVTVGKGAAWAMPREGQYHETFGETEMTTWEIVVLAAPQSIGYARGQQAVDPYVSKSGVASVKAAIEADGTLGGVVHCLSVTRWYDRGLIECNGQQFWGVKLEVVVYE